MYAGTQESSQQISQAPDKMQDMLTSESKQLLVYVSRCEYQADTVQACAECSVEPNLQPKHSLPLQSSGDKVLWWRHSAGRLSRFKFGTENQVLDEFRLRARNT